MFETLAACILMVMKAGVGFAPNAAEVSGASPAGIESQVYAELASSADGRSFVIIILRDGESAQAGQELLSRQAVAQVQERVLQRLGANEFELRYRYKTLGALAGRVSAVGLATLAADPDVVSVGADAQGHGHLNVSVPFINADAVQAMGYTGEGVTVAVLDTGIDSDHADLAGDIILGGPGPGPKWWHFLDQGLDQGEGAEDDNGHGTNVSGIITSDGNVSSVGVAPDVVIFPIKVLKFDNSGWVSDWVAGVDYVVSHAGEIANLPSMNMSLGTFQLFSQCPCNNAASFNVAFQSALAAAKNAGIVTFASSGNQGSCTTMASPACLGAASAVVAVYDQSLGREPNSGTYQSEFGSSFGACFDSVTAPDMIACFSNRSACNDLAAPGRLITAPGIGGGLSTYTGTSQASPHVAGVAALMRQVCAEAGSTAMTPDLIVSVMKATGVSTTDPCGSSPNPKRVDALAAIQGVRCICDTAVTCDDGLECTIDSCNVTTAQCVHTPVAPGTPCGSAASSPCDGPDTCDPAGNCSPNTLLDGASCDDGEFCTGPDTCTSQVCAGPPRVVHYGDIRPTGGNGAVDIDDILCVISGFSDAADCPDGDIKPCGGNSVIDIDDILAELSAFAGNFACPHPCP